MDNMENYTQFCEKCGNQIKENDKFCERCGARVNIAQNVDGGADNRITASESSNIKTDSKKSKKKLIAVISVVSALVVILAVVGVIFVPKMFGGKDKVTVKGTEQVTTVEHTTEVVTTAEPTTVEPTNADPLSKTENDIVQKADNEFGYVFNINPSEFEVMYNNAVIKLGIDEDYKIQLSDFKKEKTTFLNADAISYSYENQKLGTVDFTVNEETNQIEYISTGVNTDKDDTNSSETIMNNRTTILIKMLTPNLSKTEVQNLANALYNSEKRTVEMARTVFNNFVYYYLAQYENPDSLEVGCIPVTKEYYENLNFADESSVTESEEKRTSFNGFSIEIPDTWTYEVEGDKVSFYEEYIYDHPETGSKGFLFAIEKTTDEPVNSINSVVLAEKDGYYFIQTNPTGFGILKDDYANERMHDALSATDEVISTFRIE